MPELVFPFLNDSAQQIAKLEISKSTYDF